MRILAMALVLALPVTAASSDWATVTALPAGKQVVVIPVAREAKLVQGTLTGAAADSLTVRQKSGEVSLRREEVRVVKVENRSRRPLNGALGIGIGAAVGAAIGGLACVSCPNEGHGYKYVGAGLAVGAGIGALMLLPTPFRTVYKAPKR